MAFQFLNDWLWQFSRERLYILLRFVPHDVGGRNDYIHTHNTHTQPSVHTRIRAQGGDEIACKACDEAYTNGDSRNLRGNPSIIVQHGGKNILIDCGKTFRVGGCRKNIRKNNRKINRTLEPRGAYRHTILPRRHPLVYSVNAVIEAP